VPGTGIAYGTNRLNLITGKSQGQEQFDGMINFFSVSHLTEFFSHAAI
jgi:hypothetical protein